MYQNCSLIVAFDKTGFQELSSPAGCFIALPVGAIFTGGWISGSEMLIRTHSATDQGCKRWRSYRLHQAVASALEHIEPGAPR